MSADNGIYVLHTIKDGQYRVKELQAIENLYWNIKEKREEASPQANQENNLLNQYKNLINNSNNTIDDVLNLTTKLKSQLDAIVGAQKTLNSQNKSLFVVSNAIDFPKRK